MSLAKKCLEDVATRDSTHNDHDDATNDEGGAGAVAPPLQRQSSRINDPTRRKKIWSTIKRSKNCLLRTAAASSSVWEPNHAQKQRFASSIALIGSSVWTESSVLVSPNMNCRVLRVAGHSSSQCSRIWLSWKHFGHLGSVVGSIRWRYAARCMLCSALSLANMTASLLLVSVFSSLAIEWLAYTAAVLACEGSLSFRIRLITALAAFRLVGWASSSSSVASLANLSESSFPGMPM